MNPFYEKREQKLQAGISKNMKFPEHLHEDMELLLVEDGQIEVTIMGNSRILSQGDCAVIFPEQIHSYRTPEDSRIDILIFGESFLGSYRRSVQKFCPADPFLCSGQLPEDVRLAFDRLLALAKGETLLQNWDETDLAALESAWVQVLLSLLMPSLQLEKRSKSENMDITGRLVQYIMEHFREQLTLEGLARELHVNKYYLSHIFSERLQMGFRQYLNQIRLEHAMYEISTTDYPITRIWEEAGFNSQRSFNRIFMDSVGMTPLEYRKKQKRK